MRFEQFEIEVKDGEIFISQDGRDDGADCIHLSLEQVGHFVDQLARVARMALATEAGRQGQ